jgi:glutathione S-transferase
LDQQLSILDGGIGDGGWLAGRSISLAEICLGPIVERCLNFPVELSALPRLRAWCGEVRARPAFKSATA